VLAELVPDGKVFDEGPLVALDLEGDGPLGAVLALVEEHEAVDVEVAPELLLVAVLVLDGRAVLVDRVQAVSERGG